LAVDSAVWPPAISRYHLNDQSITASPDADAAGQMTLFSIAAGSYQV
jgi:hypothetical protein